MQASAGIWVVKVPNLLHVAAYSSGRCNFGCCSFRVSDPEVCSCTPISLPKVCVKANPCASVSTAAFENSWCAAASSTVAVARS